MAHSIVGSGVKDTMMEVVLKSLVGQKGLIIFNLLFLFNSPVFKNSLMATGLERVCVCVCVCDHRESSRATNIFKEVF